MGSDGGGLSCAAFVCAWCEDAHAASLQSVARAAQLSLIAMVAEPQPWSFPLPADFPYSGAAARERQFNEQRAIINARLRLMPRKTGVAVRATCAAHEKCPVAWKHVFVDGNHTVTANDEDHGVTPRQVWGQSVENRQLAKKASAGKRRAVPLRI